MINLEMAYSYIASLTGDANSVMDWRVINDREKGDFGKNIRGRLSDVAQTLSNYNASMWGVFVCINALDGHGQTLDNVSYIRTHVADLDDQSFSESSYVRAVSSNMPPHFAVQTSEKKFHLYWLTEPYVGKDFYSLHQRKIAQTYGGDPSIIDATRVLRVPGFYHCKSTPTLVTCWGIHNNPRYTMAQIVAEYQHVNIVERYSSRKELGDPKLQAPSWELLLQALWLINPNELGRDEWLSISAAFKQAGWNLAPEKILQNAWEKWCGQYNGNDQKENDKLWSSLNDTQVGWGAFKRRTAIDAYILFGAKDRPAPAASDNPAPPQPLPTTPSPLPDFSGDILDGEGCKQWFKGCVFIERFGTIFTPSGRYMNSTQFNGAYGGKIFLITDAGSKTTDEAWKAALRSTLYTIPKVDHIRFLPLTPPLSIVEDKRGRKGINTYQPAHIDFSVAGDVTPFLDHWAKVLPVENDRKVLYSFLAHNIKYPGHKIPWAIFMQSTPGVGKSVFYELMQNGLGEMFVYRPNASELAEGGSKFNSWAREKLLITIDEIKVDERRELVEILKPYITETQIEIQSKGKDQDIEDVPTNWMFFSNFKDAIPISEDDRRYAVLFSALQTRSQRLAAGLTDEYFVRFWHWLRNENGFKFIINWLKNYPIELGSLPVTAPDTSSRAEAIRMGRTPFEVLLDDLIDTKSCGFRGGYVSITALEKAISAKRIRKPPEYVIEQTLNRKGYVHLGYTSTPVPGEDLTRGSLIYGLEKTLDVERYWKTQLSVV